MKKSYRSASTVASFCLGAIFFLANPSTVPAAPIAPGIQIPAPYEPGEPGIEASVEATVTAPYANADIQGTLTSTVFSGDGSNPYGGLTFTYEIMVDIGSPAAVEKLTVGNFDPFLTDVSYSDPNIADGGLGVSVPGVAPNTISRSLNGNVISYDFFPGVLPGQMSASLVIQTDAALFTPSLASVINATAVTVQSFAPAQVPEPTTFALVGLGTLALVAYRKRA